MISQNNVAAYCNLSDMNVSVMTVENIKQKRRWTET